jgi:hypothetical protein
VPRCERLGTRPRRPIGALQSSRSGGNSAKYIDTRNACHGGCARLSHDWNQNRAKAETDEISMTPIDEIRALVFHSRSRIAQDRGALRRMAEELSYTDQIIERATLAYNVSLWTLEKFERSQFNLRLSAPNPPRPGA